MVTSWGYRRTIENNKSSEDAEKDMEMKKERRTTKRTHRQAHWQTRLNVYTMTVMTLNNDNTMRIVMDWEI